MKQIILFVALVILFGCGQKTNMEIITIRDGQPEVVTTVHWEAAPQIGSYIFIEEPKLWDQLYKVKTVKYHTDFKKHKIKKYQVWVEFIPEEQIPFLY